eukprot:gene15501-29324_t
MFSRGGIQGGEGVTGGEAWYIENVMEELDSEREWFFDTPTSTFPAHHVAIQGVTLRDTVYTYFDPHGLPSGGDWALQKQGAITIVGSESEATKLAPTASYPYLLGSVITNNICHEIGLWQKQSSLWFQAVTAQTTLHNNIFYNGQ